MSPDPRQRYASASAFGAALRDYRYSAATAGDPAREIQILLKRYFGDGAHDRSSPGGEPSKVLKIQTVAGFDGPEGGADPASSPARRIFDTFDAPTVAADSARPPPVTVSNRPAGLGGNGNGAGAAGGLPSFDHGDDDETRMLDSRRGRQLPLPAEPTTAAAPAMPRERPAGAPSGKEGSARGTGNPAPIADAPASSSPSKTAAGKRKAPRTSVPPEVAPAAVTASKKPSGTNVPVVAGAGVAKATGAAAVPAVRRPETPSATGRRVLWLGGLLLVVALAAGAFLLVRFERSSSRAATPGGKTSPAAQPASGEALEGPAIQAPVKKQKKPKPP